jgi:hypothetical protein
MPHISIRALQKISGDTIGAERLARKCSLAEDEAALVATG